MGVLAHEGVANRQNLLPDAAPILDVANQGQVFALALPYGLFSPSSPTFVGGSFDSVSGTPVYNFAKVNADGTPDPAWIPRVEGDVNAIAVNNDDSVFIGGNFFSVNSAERNRLARFNADGTLDASWNVSADGGGVHALVMDVANQRLYVGGSFSYIRVGHVSHSRLGGLARFNIVSGTPVLDEAWNPGGVSSGEVFALALDSGRQAIYAGGNFSGWGTDGSIALKNLVRLSTATAQPDATFNPAPDNRVTALALLGNALYVGGHFGVIGGQPRARIAQLTLSGAPSSWNPGADGQVLAIHAPASGLWVGGNFQQIGGKTSPYLARFADSTAATPDDIDRGVNGTVRAIRQVGAFAAMRIGGRFSESFGTPCFSLLRMSDSSTAQSCAEVGTRGEIYALAATADGRWLFGGDFKRVNGQPIRHLGRTTPEGQLDGSWQPNPDAVVHAIAVGPEATVIGGEFSTVDGVSRGRLAKFNAAGVLDPHWAPAANDTVHALVLDGSSHVFAGGAFTQIDAQPRSRVARLGLAGAGVADVSFAPEPLNGAVLAMALDTRPSGWLYLGGNFGLNTSHGTSRLTRLHPVTGMRDPVWTPQANNTVRALALDVARNGIFVGGNFTRLGNRSEWNRLGKVRLDTDETDAVNFPAPGLPNAGDVVHSLHLGPDDALYVGGYFTSLNAVGQAFVARYTFNASGKATLDAGWNPGPRDLGNSVLNDTVIIRSVMRDAFGTTGIGGRFSSVSGLSRRGTAFFTDTGMVTLQYRAGPNGAIAGESLQQVPFGGDGSPVGAMPDAGHHFLAWSDGSNANPRTDVGVMDDLDVTAQFGANSYRVGGNVSGLAGSGLVLSTGAQTLAISGSGPFQFPAMLPSGSTYDVQVDAQPQTPAQTCSVTGGSGTVVDAHITDIAVSCVTHTHTVALVAGANGALTPSDDPGFPLTAVPDGQPVSIDVQPDPGYAIVHVGGCGGTLVGSVYSTAPITSDCTVSATFEDATRQIDLSASVVAETPAGMPGDTVQFRVTLSNAGPDDSQMAALHITPQEAWDGVTWRCEPSESTAACQGPVQGSGSLMGVSNLAAGAQVTYRFTGTLTAAGPQARLNADISAGPQESDVLPANNSATAAVQVQGPLFADGFEGTAAGRRH